MAHEILDGDTRWSCLRQSPERARILSMDVLEILDAYMQLYQDR